MQIQNKAANDLCIDSMAGKSVTLFACHNMGGNQMWAISADGHISNDGSCITANEDATKTEVVLQKCDKYAVDQVWMYDPNTHTIRLRANGQCLTHDENQPKRVPVLVDCLQNGRGSDEQIWRIVDDSEFDMEALYNDFV